MQNLLKSTNIVETPENWDLQGQFWQAESFEGDKGEFKEKSNITKHKSNPEDKPDTHTALTNNGKEFIPDPDQV